MLKRIFLALVRPIYNRLYSEEVQLNRAKHYRELFYIQAAAQLAAVRSQIGPNPMRMEPSRISLWTRLEAALLGIEIPTSIPANPKPPVTFRYTNLNNEMVLVGVIETPR